MQKNSGDFSMQELMQLANSPAGKQLLAMLQQNSGDTMRSAADKISAGDFSQAKALLAPLLASDEAKALLRQLGGNYHG